MAIMATIVALTPIALKGTTCSVARTFNRPSAGPFELNKGGMTCAPGGKPNWQQTVRSLHTSGGNVCFADGSVRFMSDFIELGTSYLSLGVWDKLNLSNDSQPVDASKF